jgi:hypothetical protein
MFKKIWETVVASAVATGTFIVQNKAAIGAACIVISKVIPKGTVVSDIALVLAALLTSGELAAPSQKPATNLKTTKLDKLPLNGRKTAVGNVIAGFALFENAWLFIIPFAVGLLIIILGLIHKYIKKKPESKLAVKLKVK